MKLRHISAYLLGWTTLALLFSGQYALEMLSTRSALAIEPGLRGATLYFCAWAALAWAPYSVGLRYPVQQPVLARHLSIVSIVGAVCAVTQILVRFALAHLLGWETERSLRELTAAHLSFNMIVAAAIVCASQAVAWRRRAHTHQRRERELELASAHADAELARAQLQLLGQQLQPHFLFNTLNAISALIHRDPAAADRTLQQLCELLRCTLDTGALQEWTLQEEVDLVGRYLDIQLVRFSNRLATGINIDEGAQRLAVPPFVLQLLVENAVEHGIAQRRTGGRIDIRARVHESCLVLEVENDGPELPSEHARRSSRVGLANTTARLMQLYGMAASLQVKARAGNPGCIAVMAIPAKAI